MYNQQPTDEFRAFAAAIGHSHHHEEETHDGTNQFHQQQYSVFSPQPQQQWTVDSSQHAYGSGSRTGNFDITDDSGMDWAPDNSNIHETDFVNSYGSVGETGNHGVGRLVAQFESKDYNPPLPPRPAAAPIVIHQPDSSHMDIFDSAPPGSSFSSHRIHSPIDSHFGSYTTSHVTSPPATSPPPLNFGSFQDVSRIPSPSVASTSIPFGSLDNFMNTNRIPHQMATSPMIQSPGPLSPAHGSFGGTPGFSMWRAPGQQQQQHQPDHLFQQFQQFQAQHRPEFSFTSQPQPRSNLSQQPPSQQPTPQPQTPVTDQFSPPAPAGGYFRPSVPATPKPPMSAGNQFILELNPGSKAKGKAPIKPPPKPPRPRAPSTTISIPTISTPPLFSPGIKNEPTTPGFSDVPFSALQRGESSTRSTAASSRPSREQVPAEAWDGYKTTIRDLYLEQRKPLKEVMSIMADKYNFQATPKMYKTRFSQWGFVKNNTEDEVKRLLAMKFQRDAEGKVSEFVRNGKIVNLSTYLKRKGVTEYDLVDFEQPSNLPSHIRCRTPTPPPTPEYLKSPDLLRAQELVVGSMRKAFLQCRQYEVEIESQISWQSIMVWGAPSSEMLTEANFYFEAGDVDAGGQCLMRAFKQLEVDLKQLSPQAIVEVLLGMVRRDPGLMTALCKYVAAFSTTNYDRTHPLRQIFSCLYEVQQKHGSATLSDLLWGSMPLIAEELEAIYGPRHPYVARTWIDLALYYEHRNVERQEKLAAELKALHKQMEQRSGIGNGDVLAVRFAMAQLLYSANPTSSGAKSAASDVWRDLRKANLVHKIRDPRPRSYCFHCPVKVDPWTKRCRRRYDSIVELVSKHVEVIIDPYFEEDFHTASHEMDSQDAWAAASGGQPMSTSRWGFL